MVLTEHFPAARDRVRHRRPASRKVEPLGYPRNRWNGIHAGREFLYDLRHPMLFRRRVIAGLRGEIPQVSKEQRVFGIGLMIVGGLNVLMAQRWSSAGSAGLEPHRWSRRRRGLSVSRVGSAQGAWRSADSRTAPRVTQERRTRRRIAVPKQGDVHVLPADKGWRIEVEGSSQARSTHKTQSGAATAARVIAKRNKSELLIHGRNGRVRDRSTYGHDPRRTKG